MAPKGLSVWVELPLDVDLNKPQCFLGTNLELRLGYKAAMDFQSMLDAIKRMGPMVSKSVVVPLGYAKYTLFLLTFKFTLFIILS